jgi:hypothetical protein
VNTLLIWVSWFAGIFVVTTTLVYRKYIPWPRMLTRISFSALILFSAFAKSVMYHPGKEPSPAWFSTGVNALLILVALTLIVANWRHDR